MLVVDPTQLLAPDGQIAKSDPRKFDITLRIARFIEYGGPLRKMESRETLVECKRRVKNKRCLGLMTVFKAEDGGILAHCSTCQDYEAYIQNWQDTPWAGGMKKPVISLMPPGSLAPPASARSA